MKKIILALSLVSGLCLTASCKKEDAAKTKASGELSTSEKGLLAHLPGDAQLVFGGKYDKFVDYWKNSPLKEVASGLMKMAGSENDMGSYMSCWMDQGLEDTTLGGTLAFQGDSGNLRMIFTGLGKDVFTKCAGKSGMTSKLDEDGKYIELQNVPDGMGGNYNMGYYFIDDTTTYFAMKISMSGSVPIPSNRAALEADLAAAKTSSAASSEELSKLAQKADRSKSFWFAGTTKGTPAADKLKGGVGWMDADSTSMSMGFSVQLVEASMAGDAVKAFEQAKGQVSNLPANFQKAAKEFLKDVHLSADGDTLNGRFKLTNDVLDQVIPQAKMMLGL